VESKLIGNGAQWLGGGVLLTLMLIAAWTLGSGTPAVRDAEAPAGTATIARTTLLDARTQTGTLGFGASVDVPFISKERSGIVTWMAPEGTVVARGEPLFAIDGQPVILFYGELPTFRTLRFGDESFGEFEWLELNNAGDDQRKTELNLALQQARLAEAEMKLKVARDKLSRTEQLRERGFTTPADTDQVRSELATAETAVATAQLAVHEAARALRDAQDTRSALLSSANADADVEILRKNLAELGYEGAAADAVRRWQAATGHSASGLIEPGQIAVAPGPVRVADHLAEVGDVVFSGAGQGGLGNGADPVVRYTSMDRMVSVSLGIADHAYAKPGDPVVVTLPTNVEVQGVIAEVSTVFDAQGLAITEIAIPDQATLGTLEAASVDVEFVVGKRTDVLAVPIAALLALPEGGFGVELVDGTSRRIVPVSTGLFARGSVEISGPDIAEGLAVGVP
jgi:uncharacterized Zn-binding protein involved in type VI secretion